MEESCNWRAQIDSDITDEVVLEIEQQVISEDKQIMVGILKKRELKGRVQGRQEIIEKMFRDGMEISDIARITGRSEKEIADLRNGA